MKKLFTLALIFTLLVSCEKWELVPGKLNGTFISEMFELVDIDSIKINLNIDEGIIKEVFITPAYFKYKH